jgi:hypothetical protein
MALPACASHPEAGSAFSCSRCGKPFCAACRRVWSSGVAVCPGCAAGAAKEAGFCAGCLSESTAEPAGDVSDTGAVGRKLYGAAEPCLRCGAVVATLWWVLVEIPLIPRGSYRYKIVRDDPHPPRLLSRRTHTRWAQLLTQWVLGLCLAGALLAAFYYWGTR